MGTGASLMGFYRLQMLEVFILILIIILIIIILIIIIIIIIINFRHFPKSKNLFRKQFSKKKS